MAVSVAVVDGVPVRSEVVEAVNEPVIVAVSVLEAVLVIDLVAVCVDVGVPCGV